jgi:hypothetical protein
MSANFNKLDGIKELTTPSGDYYLRGNVPPRVKAEFESWMEGYARKRVFHLRPGGTAPEDEQLQPDEYKDSLRGVTEAVGAGTFRWGGDACLQAINQIPGITRLIVLLSRSADRVMKIDQKLTEEIVLGWIDPQGEKGGATWMLVCDVVKEVLESSPNFLAPPMTGAAD